MRTQRSKSAFTLLEIMIVVAFIGLLAALAMPTFIKARKRSQGSRIVNDARQIDLAVEGWAMEYAKRDGDAVDVPQAAQYTKSGTINPTDLLGNRFSIGPVGPTQVLVSVTTKSALNGVGVDWSPY